MFRVLEPPIGDHEPSQRCLRITSTSTGGFSRRHLCSRLTAAGSARLQRRPFACSSVKNSSLLICTASAFSERYLGVPLRDDSRYQVRVYCLPSLCLPPISEKPLRHTWRALSLSGCCYQSRRQRCFAFFIYLFIFFLLTSFLAL